MHYNEFLAVSQEDIVVSLLESAYVTPSASTAVARCRPAERRVTMGKRKNGRNKMICVLKLGEVHIKIESSHRAACRSRVSVVVAGTAVVVAGIVTDALSKLPECSKICLEVKKMALMVNIFFLFFFQEVYLSNCYHILQIIRHNKSAISATNLARVCPVCSKQCVVVISSAPALNPILLVSYIELDNPFEFFFSPNRESCSISNLITLFSFR